MMHWSFEGERQEHVFCQLGGGCVSYGWREREDHQGGFVGTERTVVFVDGSDMMFFVGHDGSDVTSFVGRDRSDVTSCVGHCR